MAGYKYRVPTHATHTNTNTINNVGEQQRLLLNKNGCEDDEEQKTNHSSSKTSSMSSSTSSSIAKFVALTVVVTVVALSVAMKHEQRASAFESRSSSYVIPEPGVAQKTSSSSFMKFFQEAAEGKQKKTASHGSERAENENNNNNRWWITNLFSNTNTNNNNNNNNNKQPQSSSAFLGSEHYSLKDVAQSFKMLEYERDKMRGQSNSLHVFSWTPQAGFEMFDLGPTKEQAEKDASIDRWQRPGWTFDFIKKGLVTYFPKRFDGVHDPRPFRVVISHADYQTIPCSNPNNNKKCDKLPSPVFTFGSVPTHADSKMENLKQMPTFSTLECLWGHMTAKSEPEHGKCRWFVPQTKYEGHCEDKAKENWSFLDAGEVQLWENVPFNSLTPKIVWRGADYPFIAAFSKNDFGQTAALFFKRNARLKLRDMSAEKVIETVGEQNLPPRLHAALLSKAEPDWIDVKFLRPSVIPGFGDVDDQYKGLETKEPMTKCEMARFKYHIDIGGNGGTTWQGTIDKLAMPGLLFHHDSGMKDHFHDELKPWVHYVPVAVDLTDLKIKYEWAERNPEKAEKIAKNGQEWVRNFISEKGMEEQVQKYFVEPMTEYIAKYDDDCEMCTKEKMSFAQKVHAVTEGSMSAAKMSWSKRNELQ
jgi:hypothetical protein